MFQCLLAFLNDGVPLAIASMASLKKLLVDMPLILNWLHLLTLRYFFVNFGPKGYETFSLWAKAW